MGARGVPGPHYGTGRFLAEQRDLAGATQQAVADVLGVTKSTVSNWELGRHLPTSDVRDRWAQACADAAKVPRRRKGPAPGRPDLRRPVVVAGAELQRIREAAGVSRGRVAGVIGMGSAAIKRWEHGECAAPAHIARSWAEHCAEAARRQRLRRAVAWHGMSAVGS